MKRVFERTKEKAALDSDAITMLEDTNGALRTELEAMRDSLELATKEAMNLKDEAVVRDRKLQQLRLEMREMEDKKDGMQAEMASMKYQIATLQAEIEERQEQLENAQSKTKAYKSDFEDSRLRLEVSRIESSDARDKANEMKKVLDLSVTTLEALKKECDHKDKELARLRGSGSSSELKVKSRSGPKSLKDQLDESEDNKIELREQVHTYAQEIRRLETENAALQQTAATYMAELKGSSFFRRIRCGL